jgi:RNA-directed DNA polymerase
MTSRRASYRRHLALALANAFLARGSWTHAGLLSRASQCLVERVPWVSRLVSRVLTRFQDRDRVRAIDLEDFIYEDEDLYSASGPEDAAHVKRFLVPEPAMRRAAFAVPPIATTADLALWLDVSRERLAWLADARGLERLADDQRLRHYRYTWVAKRSGGGARLLEAPKPSTKTIQRKILAEILDPIPPHDAAHGFRPHRSIASHAALHERKPVILKLDLADFFLSVRAPRVAAVFRSAGYPEEVAWLLTCLTTNVAPVAGALDLKRSLGEYATQRDLEDVHRATMLARTRHLPQGAPTSPALANLCAYRLDVRLTKLAESWGATYSRYADDLTFSGSKAAAHLAPLAAAIVLDEGFIVNHRKTRIMKSAGRQLVTGLVVNHRARVRRDDFARLKAILHNCVRHGPTSQNRTAEEDFRAHLAGRIAHVARFDHQRGVKLRAMFDRIAWD